MSRVRIALVNGLLFQAQWFLCVQGNNVLAVIATLLFFFIHIAFIVRGLREIMFIVGFATAGWLIDSIGNTFGLILFSSAMPVNMLGMGVELAPVWLLCIWLSFSSTLIYSFYWLHKRLLTGALLGFVIVPLNYFVGAKLSGSVIGLSLPTVMLIVASIWAVLMPIGLVLAARHSHGGPTEALSKRYA